MADAHPDFTPWDDRSLDNLLGDAAAVRATSLAAISQATAGLLEAAAASAPAPVDVALRRQAAHLQWQVSIWQEHLGATGTDLPAEAAHVQAVIDQAAGAQDTLASVGAVARVLYPRLIAASRYYSVAAALDEDSTRWYDLIAADLGRDRQELEMFTQALRTTEADAERLASWVAQLESLLVTAGGLVGPGTLGGAAATARGSSR